MGDSNDNGIPAWQRASEASSASEPTDSGSSDAGRETTEDKLAIARRFLEDEKVKNEPRDKKAAFLKSKGVEDEQIHALLGEAQDTATGEASSSTPKPQQKASSTSAATDRAPIVTYPEFLTKPQRPPPLVTTHGLLTTLYGFAGLSTIVYGASKFVVEPMIQSLNGARQELHDTTASKLEELVHQLERTVSVVPPLPPKKTGHGDDAPSSPRTSTTTTVVGGEADEDDEDPVEMFHRDMGTQTSFSYPQIVPSAADAKGTEEERQRQQLQQQPPAMRHATNVAKLAKCVSGLRDAVVSQSGDFEDIKAQVEHFREDLDRIIFPQMDFTTGGGYGMLSAASSKNEPDDEVRKARDNIRRIKGVLLSTRSFPSSTR